MTVTSSKKTQAIVGVLLFAVCVSAFLLFISSYSLGGSIFLLILGSAVVLRYWIAVGRTITFAKEGIYVQILDYTRFYSWEKVHYKNYFDCTNSYGYKSAYYYGAEFSLSFSKRPLWLMPSDYSFILHPWTYVFVYFGPQDQTSVNSGYPCLYEVEEYAFRKRMLEWEVLP